MTRYFHSVPEAMDVAATLGLEDLSARLGWRLRQDVQENTQIKMRRDGSVTVTLYCELPPMRTKALLDVLRDPGREPSTIAKVIEDTLALRAAAMEAGR